VRRRSPRAKEEAVPDASTIAVFLAAARALLIVPGPAVLYIVARGIDQGRRAALVSALGVGVGTLGHVAEATLGLSALLVSSATAFVAAKYLGAAYLVVLGLRKLLARDAVQTREAPAPKRLSRIFGQGILTNASQLPHGTVHPGGHSAAAADRGSQSSARGALRGIEPGCGLSSP